MGSQGISNPSKNPSNKPATRFDVVPPGSPTAEPLQGELTSMCAFGSLVYSWSSPLSNRQGAIRRVRNPKYFILPGVDWCVATVNFVLTRRRVPKSLLPFFCPTKAPMSALATPCMASMQESHHAPHQIKFDTDSQKFPIDSGASAHLWNQCKDFISYHALSP